MIGLDRLEMTFRVCIAAGWVDCCIDSRKGKGKERPPLVWEDWKNNRSRDRGLGFHLGSSLRYQHSFSIDFSAPRETVRSFHQRVIYSSLGYSLVIYCSFHCYIPAYLLTEMARGGGISSRGRG